MLRHVTMWKFADDDDPGENRANAITIKAGLEELAYEVHGLVSIDVYIDPARTTVSNADILLDSRFESREAFESYLVHPRHLAVKKLIDACTEEKLCMDFEEEEAELM